MTVSVIHGVWFVEVPTFYYVRLCYDIWTILLLVDYFIRTQRRAQRTGLGLECWLNREGIIIIMISAFWSSMGTDPGASPDPRWRAVGSRRDYRRLRHRAASRHHASAPANSLNTSQPVTRVTRHRIKVGHDLWHFALAVFKKEIKRKCYLTTPLGLLFLSVKLISQLDV